MERIWRPELMHACYLGDSNTGIDPAFGGMRKEEGVLSLRHRNEPNTCPRITRINHPRISAGARGTFTRTFGKPAG
jgi:hypothetical protein